MCLIIHSLSSGSDSMAAIVWTFRPQSSYEKVNNINPLGAGRSVVSIFEFFFGFGNSQVGGLEGQRVCELAVFGLSAA